MRQFGLILKNAVVAALSAATLAACADGEREAERERMRADFAEQSQVAQSWFTNGGSYEEQYFSPLDQINRGNVDRIGLAWEYDTQTTRGLEASPTVVGRRMFTTGEWGRVYALDATTGEELWQFDPEVPGQVAGAACCDIVNRGVAYWNGLVYVAALDGNLFALEEETGEVVWKTPTIDDGNDRLYTSTGAPQIAGDVVVIGNGGADFDARGYFGAYDLKTGEMRWRFYTVPGSPDEPYEHPEMETAAETWDPESRFDVGGGGTVWDSLVYDPELDLLYVGTGNAALYTQSARSPEGGDNLYLASILAIRPATGELVWHYQTVPGESWDYTATQNMILADLPIEGESRKVIMQAPKNGFFYVLDRATGELLSAENFVPVNWADGIDMETGRPNITERANYFAEPKIIWPAAKGGHGWRPMAMSPKTGLVYIPVYEDAMLTVNLFPNGYEYRKGEPNGGMAPLPLSEAAIDFYAPILPYDIGMLKEMVRNSDAPPRRALLRAWDPVTQKTAWEVENEDFRDGGGVLATAGGLVFQSGASGKLNIYDADSGEKLRAIETGRGMMAAPSSYMVDGVQYVAVMAGLGGGGFFTYSPANAPSTYGNFGRLLVFKLDGTNPELPRKIDAGPFPEPPPLEASLASVIEGQKKFLFNCSNCHQLAGPGITPDLRRLTADKYALLDDIVLGGLLEQNGMPNFKGRLTPEDVEDIRAFIIAASHLRKNPNALRPDADSAFGH